MSDSCILPDFDAREAAEQCERLTVPEVRDMQSLDRLLKTWPEERLLLFCDEEKGDGQNPVPLFTLDLRAASR